MESEDSHSYTPDIEEEPVEEVREDGYNEYTGPPSKKKKTSKVWVEFKQMVNDKGEVKARCLHCKMVLASGPKTGTSHLKRHLLDYCPKRPNGPLGEVGVGDDVDAFVFDMKELRKEIMLFVVEGAHPFSIVEEVGYRRMMRRSNPLFEPFSRTSLSRDLFSTYFEEREKLKTILKSLPGRICLTTDNWASKHTWQNYICITAHFVDANWKLHKRILRFRSLAPPYSGVSISEEIFMFLNQWNLEDKILSVTVDNATYNDSMINHFRSRLKSRGMLVSNGRFLHIRCCAHIVNLIVQSGLKSIDDILDKIRTLLKMILKSTSKCKEFYELAHKNFHLDDKRRISLDIKIRWNSTYKMIDDVLYFKDVFVNLGSRSAYANRVPLDSDWEDLVTIHKFLKLFYDVTCMFSAVKTPTSNLYFKGAWLIHRQLLAALNSQHAFLRSMGDDMMGKFDKYWSEYNVYLSCAAILDPRFKVKFVEYCLVNMFGDDYGLELVAEVMATLKSLFDEYKLRSSTSPIVVAPPAPSSGLGYDDLLDDYDNYTPKSTNTQPKLSQLESYLNEAPLGHNVELDVLEYWRGSTSKYPDLALLARDMLTIPVSTVASESAFSIGGKTISPNRSSLKSKTVQALICVQDWRRDELDIPLDLEFDAKLSDERSDEEDVDLDDDTFAFD